MATTTTMTAEEYLLLPDSGCPTELVQGKVLTMNPPSFRHGQLCAQIAYLLRRYLEGNDQGSVITNDSGIITGSDPDTVRGADVAYYSYQRVPKQSLPTGYAPVPPELVVEVLSPRDRSDDIEVKIHEYLTVGVTVVAVIDDRQRQIHIHRNDKPKQILTESDTLTFPELFSDFSVAVSSVFV